MHHLKLCFGTVLVAIAASVAAAPAKKQNAFSYEKGIQAYLNSPSGRNFVPAQLISFDCTGDGHPLKPEYHCDVWLQGQQRTHKYIARLKPPQAPLTAKYWNFIRSPKNRGGGYDYLFEAAGAPPNISRAQAEADMRVFLQWLMADVAVSQRNEAKFVNAVKAQRSAPGRPISR